MINWTTINAPKSTTVTAAGLAAAISAAIPGEIITVSAAGSPIDLDLSGVVKLGYGVCILLPLDQAIRGRFINCRGLHFFGGLWACETVLGGRGSTHNGVTLTSGNSRLSWHGAHFDLNENGVRGTASTDIWLRGCRFDVQRGDIVQVDNCQKLLIEGNTTGEGIRGESLCYYSDGRAPTENIDSGACVAAGGVWEDQSHADLFQGREGVTDVIFQDNVMPYFGVQGFVDFGGGADIGRVQVYRNVLSKCDVWGISLGGYDIDVRDNVIGTGTGMGTARLAVTKEGVGRVFGGRNTAPLVTNPSGVDLSSATLNGDTVVSPARPDIILPGWAPPIPAPPVRGASVPTHTGGGGIRVGGVAASPAPTAASVGDWLSINRGTFTGADGATWEFRWKRNGAVISGAASQVYQTISADTGATITGEVRGTNSQGTGGWAAYSGVAVT